MCIYICIYVCMCIYIYMCVCVYVWMDGVMDGWMHGCMYVRTYVCNIMMLLTDVINFGISSSG